MRSGADLPPRLRLAPPLAAALALALACGAPAPSPAPAPAAGPGALAFHGRAGTGSDLASADGEALALDLAAGTCVTSIEGETEAGVAYSRRFDGRCALVEIDGPTTVASFAGPYRYAYGDQVEAGDTTGTLRFTWFRDLPRAEQDALVSPMLDSPDDVGELESRRNDLAQRCASVEPWGIFCR